jgi:hypothetical protein
MKLGGNATKVHFRFLSFSFASSCPVLLRAHYHCHHCKYEQQQQQQQQQQ